MPATDDGGVGIEPKASTLTIAQAAERLGICRESVYRAVRRGEIPVIRIGKLLLVPREPFERLLRGEEATPILK